MEERPVESVDAHGGRSFSECSSVWLKGQELVGKQQDKRPKEERTETAYEDGRFGHSSDALGDLARVSHA